MLVYVDGVSVFCDDIDDWMSSVCELPGMSVLCCHVHQRLAISALGASAHLFECICKSVLVTAVHGQEHAGPCMQQYKMMQANSFAFTEHIMVLYGEMFTTVRPAICTTVIQ